MSAIAENRLGKTGWGAVLISALLLMACSKTPESDVGTTVSAPEAPVQSSAVQDVKAVGDQELAIKLMGEYISSADVPLLLVKDIDLKPLEAEWLDPNSFIVPTLWFRHDFSLLDRQYHTAFVQLQEFGKDTGEIISVSGIGVPVSAMTYLKTEAGWEEVSRQKLPFAYLGNWGSAPDIDQKKLEYIMLAPGKQVMLVPDGHSRQGYTSRFVNLLMFDGKTWQALGDVQLSENNDGECDDDKDSEYFRPCWAYTGNITVLPLKSDNLYPDILVRNEGTWLDGQDKVVPASDVTYTFKDHKYVRTGTH
ncbi:MAG: hypothetical protein ACRDD3_13860 [Azovibrio sp.]